MFFGAIYILHVVVIKSVDKEPLMAEPYSHKIRWKIITSQNSNLYVYLSFDRALCFNISISKYILEYVYDNFGWIKFSISVKMRKATLSENMHDQQRYSTLLLWYSELR